MMNMTVTTLDLQTGYEVIGPVCGSCREQTDPDQAFLEALREIRKSAAMLQADAVIGMRQTAVPLADGTGRFHMQLYGTAVREIEEAPMETGFAAAAGNGIQTTGRQEGDFLIDGSTLVRYVGQSEYVRIPDGIINIGAESFHNARVVSVEIPDSVTEIREGAFSGSERLERIRLSTRLLVIRKNAFQGCVSLSDIALPASLQEIDKAAFSACPELPAVTEFIRRKEAEAKDAEYLRSRRPVWRRQGRCQYCGGFFKGGLKGMKVCSMCGMEKDY
ncbi:leucine-rich repeat protein [Sarcina sp. DSM 11001]|uniref:leucine-rich repeat protein n=1 Tax=Sarcina sp. DSM 11001 TaxID=1798184 RepID=UPI0015874EF9|nr:leucine-rich repeat protein [Sarcina sp. DSM 11001]